MLYVLDLPAVPRSYIDFTVLLMENLIKSNSAQW
jgi:hypothetical protein